MSPAPASTPRRTKARYALSFPASPILPLTASAQNYRARYWKEPYFRALEQIEAVAEKYNLTMAEIALRWISHHSLMKREYGDAVLIGASSTKHIEQNLIDLEKGPLRECYALDLLHCD